MERREHLLLIMTKIHGRAGKMTMLTLSPTVLLWHRDHGPAIPPSRQTTIQEAQETRRQDQATTPLEFGNALPNYAVLFQIFIV